jgi:hypothetical protein
MDGKLRATLHEKGKPRRGPVDLNAHSSSPRERGEDSSRGKRMPRIRWTTGEAMNALPVQSFRQTISLPHAEGLRDRVKRAELSVQNSRRRVEAVAAGSRVHSPAEAVEQGPSARTGGSVLR